MEDVSGQNKWQDLVCPVRINNKSVSNKSLMFGSHRCPPFTYYILFKEINSTEIKNWSLYKVKDRRHQHRSEQRAYSKKSMLHKLPHSGLMISFHWLRGQWATVRMSVNQVNTAHYWPLHTLPACLLQSVWYLRTAIITYCFYGLWLFVLCGSECKHILMNSPFVNSAGERDVALTLPVMEPWF